MSDKRAMAWIISDDPDGIVAEVHEWFDAKAVDFGNWEAWLPAIEKAQLIVIDECGTRGNSDSSVLAAERTLGSGGQGPFVIVLAGDNDFHFEPHADAHKRLAVHHYSRSLRALVQELWHALPAGYK